MYCLKEMGFKCRWENRGVTQIKKKINKKNMK